MLIYTAGTIFRLEITFFYTKTHFTFPFGIQHFLNSHSTICWKVVHDFDRNSFNTTNFSSETLPRSESSEQCSLHRLHYWEYATMFCNRHAIRLRFHSGLFIVLVCVWHIDTYKNAAAYLTVKFILYALSAPFGFDFS